MRKNTQVCIFAILASDGLYSAIYVKFIVCILRRHLVSIQHMKNGTFICSRRNCDVLLYERQIF